jgi:butyrate kinase
MIFAKILVIYPQETNTKIAIYKNNNLLFLKKIRHTPDELKGFKAVVSQCAFRTALVYKELLDNEVKLDEISLVISRGGLIQPVKSGVYEVNNRMMEDLKVGINGEHAINLGGLLAHAMLQYLPNARACIADPVVVDELEDVARVSGHPDFSRKSIFHALNQKYISRIYARSLHVNYEDMNLIVAHMGGGGCSVAAHKQGKVVDVNQAFDGSGPFAITRTGTLPAGDLVKMCFDGKHSKEEIIKMITAEGGMKAHLGTANTDELEKMVNDGDEKARFIVYALAYQIAKEIASMYAVLGGKVDAIILSGEIYTLPLLVDNITLRVENLGKLVVFSNVNDMDALAMNGLMVLSGDTEWLEYL